MNCMFWGLLSTWMLVGFLFWWPLVSYSFHYWAG